MRHVANIEEKDNVSDERAPDCPACNEPLGDSRDRHSHHHRTRRG